MPNSLAVTVSGVKGTSHFKLSRKTVARLKLLMFGIIVTLFVVTTTVLKLVDEVQLSREKQAFLETQSSDLSTQLEQYQNLKQQLEGDISAKEDELLSVSSRLEEIEEYLGGEKLELDMNSRLDLAAINTAVRLELLKQIPNGSPVKIGRRSSRYGMRTHPVTKKKTMHRGLDFAVNTGTAIYSPADGVIEVTRKSDKGSGNFIRISHSFGITSSYSHMKSFKVKSGQFVKKGDLIGYSGNSGLTSGPHLHYEIRFVGRSMNPANFVDWNIDNFESLFENQKGIQWDFLIKSVEQQVSMALQLSSPKGHVSPES
ncbi:peptidoglycan DD-metalloendopeptidase family protein [Vibrio sp. SCSIO 43137]|uniref:peptidoglycan DD-metalloendopeptidase family protein n=1 Tax=Vibrio sp. SCSIO 43137 TaxID=3021011 RepID=UPI002307DDB4|nr:peptidoglycan DD-metalloendopeptidase family protein [Vibrio sp. SCSIO 43137]WCE31050.1 peptidoglycan DD-metalloendopeptidase family protein [Vibrio sp. SCSIO 43137]